LTTWGYEQKCLVRFHILTGCSATSTTIRTTSTTGTITTTGTANATNAVLQGDPHERHASIEYGTTSQVLDNNTFDDNLGV